MRPLSPYCREMEAEDRNNEPSLPFAYLGPNHPTIYFPDSARHLPSPSSIAIFHRHLRPHPVILSKTTKVAGASLDLKVNEEAASAADVDNPKFLILPSDAAEKREAHSN